MQAMADYPAASGMGWIIALEYTPSFLRLGHASESSDVIVIFLLLRYVTNLRRSLTTVEFVRSERFTVFQVNIPEVAEAMSDTSFAVTITRGLLRMGLW